MIDNLLFGVTLVAALGCGLITGVFFAFSSFVMKALGQMSPPEGIAAMQAINILVINQLFLGVFVGTGVVCVLLIIAAIMRWDAPSATWLLVGGALYLLGTLAVTGVRNVPMNDALAAFATTDPAGVAYWAIYLRDWTFWNHVRTIAALAATTALIMALRVE